MIALGLIQESPTRAEQGTVESLKFLSLIATGSVVFLCS